MKDKVDRHVWTTGQNFSFHCVVAQYVFWKVEPTLFDHRFFHMWKWKYAVSQLLNRIDTILQIFLHFFIYYISNE